MLRWSGEGRATEDSHVISVEGVLVVACLDEVEGGGNAREKTGTVAIERMTHEGECVLQIVLQSQRRQPNPRFADSRCTSRQMR